MMYMCRRAQAALLSQVQEDNKMLRQQVAQLLREQTVERVRNKTIL